MPGCHPTSYLQPTHRNSSPRRDQFQSFTRLSHRIPLCSNPMQQLNRPMYTLLADTSEGCSCQCLLARQTMWMIQQPRPNAKLQPRPWNASQQVLSSRIMRSQPRTAPAPLRSGKLGTPPFTAWRVAPAPCTCIARPAACCTVPAAPSQTP